MTYNEFAQKQSLLYAAKIIHAEIRAREFYDTIAARGMYSMGWGEVLTYIGVGWEDEPTVSIY